jgi:hypothetical protein
MFLQAKVRSREVLVGITRLRAGWTSNRGSILRKGKEFVTSYSVQAWSGAHTGPYWMGTVQNR